MATGHGYQGKGATSRLAPPRCRVLAFSFIPHPSSLILHPSSLILHPSSFIPHPFPALPPSFHCMQGNTHPCATKHASCNELQRNATKRRK
jgi:hypothetical protein